MKLVPTRVFGPVLLKILEGYETIDEGLEILSEKTGYSTDTIWTVAHQRRRGCDFDLADKLLCAAGRVSEWRGPVLHDIYYGTDISMERCALEGCDVFFHPVREGKGAVEGPSRKLYCSKECRMAARHLRTGRTNRVVKRHRGGPGAATRCRNGHERTPENTRVRANGKTECGICAREANKRSYHARQRAKREATT